MNERQRKYDAEMGENPPASARVFSVEQAYEASPPVIMSKTLYNSPVLVGCCCRAYTCVAAGILLLYL